MAKWFPTPDETFVFRPRCGEYGQSVVILVPGGKEPQYVEIDGDAFELDEEKTEQVRMHVRVAERKRIE